MAKATPFTTEWRDNVLKLLRNRPRYLTWHKIASDTGLGEAWLSLLNRDKITNPNINMMNCLYEYLIKNKS